MTFFPLRMEARATIALSVAAALIGCATPPDRIAMTPVSVIQYQNYTCDNIAADAYRVVARMAELAPKLEQRASLDTMTIAGGFILWPMLLMTSGDRTEAAEYARLKGERQALEQTAITKGCRL